jgi:hypothetical protein
VLFAWNSGGNAARSLAATDAEGDTVTYTLNICSNQGMTEGCQTHQIASLGDSRYGRFALAGMAIVVMGFVGVRRKG